VISKCKNQELILEVSGKDGKLHKVHYKVQDAAKLSYPDNFFDRIICLSSIEHFFDDTAAMKEMARTLKPGGLVAVTTCFGLEYSQDEVTPGQYKDAHRVYSKEALFSRLIDPSGLKIGDHDFSLSESTWKSHELPGQYDWFVSVAFVLRKL
jgi:ubiquinone/menaquinone biosynthesis C-methylase UbiE